MQNTGPQAALFYVKSAAKMMIFALLAGSLVAVPALAEVRIGNNVRIGGHDVSNQTFTQERNGVFYIYEDNPKNPGCRWRDNGDGTRTKICHLKRKN